MPIPFKYSPAFPIHVHHPLQGFVILVVWDVFQKPKYYALENAEEAQEQTDWLRIAVDIGGREAAATISLLSKFATTLCALCDAASSRLQLCTQRRYLLYSICIKVFEHRFINAAAKYLTIREAVDEVTVRRENSIGELWGSHAKPRHHVVSICSAAIELLHWNAAEDVSQAEALAILDIFPESAVELHRHDGARRITEELVSAVQDYYEAGELSAHPRRQTQALYAHTHLTNNRSLSRCIIHLQRQGIVASRSLVYTLLTPKRSNTLEARRHTVRVNVRPALPGKQSTESHIIRSHCFNTFQ